MHKAQLFLKWIFNIFGFADNSFSVESLKYLKKSHMDDLLPRALYGVRVIFEYNLEQWQKKQVCIFRFFLLNCVLFIDKNLKGIYLDETLSLISSRSESTLSVSASFEEAVQNLNDVIFEQCTYRNNIIKFSFLVYHWKGFEYNYWW